MEPLKEKIRRFRQWQEQPFEYKITSDKVQHCNNCGHDFTGNFCPVCSQKADMGRIGWHSVRQGVMDIWGLGTRSLLYSLWQLLLRPGHLISDYIDGKRQVSFPPVKMLFIVAVVYSIVAYWFLPDVLNIRVDEGYGVSYLDKGLNNLSEFKQWWDKYFNWGALLMAILAVLPTWVLFRNSSRHTHHTLPEGFFIQIFLAVIMMALNFILLPVGIVSPLAYLLIENVLYMAYYLVVYHYLFGYGLWGTLWRCGFILSTVFFLLTAGVFIFFDIDTSKLYANTGSGNEAFVPSRAFVAVTYLVMAVSTFGAGLLFNLFATRKSRQQPVK